MLQASIKVSEQFQQHLDAVKTYLQLQLSLLSRMYEKCRGRNGAYHCFGPKPSICILCYPFPDDFYPQRWSGHVFLHLNLNLRRMFPLWLRAQ